MISQKKFVLCLLVSSIAIFLLVSAQHNSQSIFLIQPSSPASPSPNATDIVVPATSGPVFFKLEECTIPTTTRSTVITAFDRPFRVFLHPHGKDRFISESALKNEATGKWFEWTIRDAIIERLEELARDLGRSPLVLDVGGNIGLEALYFASKGYEVHSFEPLLSNFELLQCSAKVNDFHTLKVNNVGLGKEEGEICMDVPDVCLFSNMSLEI
jgi:hypothetical protein